jgi:N-methylhydantoinase B/oxoprolinase/acetone carboxylase alpha subunit
MLTISEAVNYNQLEIVKYLCSLGQNYADTCMVRAIRMNRSEIVKYIYSIGYDCTKHFMKHAIKYAIRDGYFGVVEYLHSIGKDYECEDNCDSDDCEEDVPEFF